MVILNQPIDTSEIQITGGYCIHLIALLASIFIAGFIMANVASNVNINLLKVLGITFISFFTPLLLISNSYRVIPLLQTPVYEKSYSNNAFYKSLTSNVDKPSFTDKYRDNINNAVDDKLGKYTIPDCTVDKPERETSLLCGGYSLDNVSAVNKDTDKTYTLTPKFHYDHKNSTVELSIKEEEGYKESY